MDAVSGRFCMKKPKGSDLSSNESALRADLVLVFGAFADAGHEQLPYARAAARLHGVLAAVPVVEAADHAHAFGVRRPHREMRAGHAVAHAQMRAELVIQPVVTAFAE